MSCTYCDGKVSGELDPLKPGESRIAYEGLERALCNALKYCDNLHDLHACVTATWSATAPYPLMRLRYCAAKDDRIIELLFEAERKELANG